MTEKGQTAIVSSQGKTGSQTNSKQSGSQILNEKTSSNQSNESTDSKSGRTDDSQKTESPKELISCYICGAADGTIITVCGCKSKRAVHFECIQTVIVNNQSLICRSCQTPYVGIQAVYAKKKISRFVSKYVRIMSYRVIGIPLFVLLLIRVIFVRSQTFAQYEKQFWIIFVATLVISVIIVAIYAYRGITAIKNYNRTNNDILDIQLSDKSDKSSPKNSLK